MWWLKKLPNLKTKHGIIKQRVVCELGAIYPADPYLKFVVCKKFFCCSLRFINLFGLEPKEIKCKLYGTVE
jgi:hypothetical protein